MWNVGNSGMTLFLYATLLKNAILEPKKHDQVDTNVKSEYVNFFNYDVMVFLKVSDLHSHSFVFFMDQHEKVLYSVVRFSLR